MLEEEDIENNNPLDDYILHPSLDMQDPIQESGGEECESYASELENEDDHSLGESSAEEEVKKMKL